MIDQRKKIFAVNLWILDMLLTTTSFFFAYSVRSLFELERGITGDITPSYSILEDKDVARMHATVPNAKIIFLMRNPFDRAWSNFRHGK